MNKPPASCSAVYPSCLISSVIAPARKSIDTHTGWPASTPRCNGVDPRPDEKGEKGEGWEEGGREEGKDGKKGKGTNQRRIESVSVYVHRLAGNTIIGPQTIGNR